MKTATVRFLTGFIVASLCAGSVSAETSYDALDAYIGEKLPNFHHSERAKAVKNTLVRIQTENWWDDDATFSNISNQLNHVLSCYFYAVGSDKISLDLIDEVEFLVANTDDQKKLYHRFITRDSKAKHEMIPEEECY